MANLRKFISLSGFERLLLVQAFLMLAWTSLSLRFFGLKKRYTSGNNNLSCSLNEKNSSLVQATTRMVQIAGRYSPFTASCLAQSLVLLKLLRNQGIIAHLRIGVQKAADQVKAHAWVELQGEVLNDSADVSCRYIPFKNPIPF